MYGIRWGVVPAAVALVAVMLGACTGGGSTGASKPPNSTASAANTTSGPPVQGALHGIILGNRNEPAPFGAQVVALDPQTGSSTQTRNFAGGDGADSSAQLTFDVNNVLPGYTFRADFNPAFTQIAATGPTHADHSSDAGFVDLHGDFHALTKSAQGGFGTVTARSAVGFDPSGNLWYVQSNADDGSNATYGYVDPATRTEHLVRDPSPAPGSAGVFFVDAGDGKYRPVQDSVTQNEVILPNGVGVLVDPVAVVSGEKRIYQVGPYQTLSPGSGENNFRVEPPGAGASMDIPVDSHRFLGFSDHQIWLGTVGDGAVSLRPLLADSNWTVGDRYGGMTISPDHTQVAFVAADPGGNMHLFVTPISGYKSQPNMLPGADQYLGDKSLLVDWLP
jgi:hypothetical protein